uniref:carbonyl reductase (NADPH) n=1 Tax=Plectus sambesii TaxID=2011161 RepID=A0A914VNU0_9BILA
MSARVAVVTGSNKGIGYGIVKGLCKQLSGGIVYLTARNPDLGQKAIANLKGELSAEEHAKIRFHQLDITDEASAIKFGDHLKQEHGGVDILVNNAGFAFNNDATEPFGEQAVVTIGINYYGTKKFCDVIFPLLRPHARVVNVCSQAGLIKSYSDELKNKLLSEKLTVAEVDEFVENFTKYAKEGTHQKHGYPNSTYRVSKAAEIALTFIQHRQALKDSREDIVINACCPGYVNTDMTNHKGSLTIEEGADTPVYLALLPPGTTDPKGKFVYQRKVISWAESGMFGS